MRHNRLHNLLEIHEPIKTNKQQQKKQSNLDQNILCVSHVPEKYIKQQHS